MSHTRLEVCRDPAGGRVRVVVRTDGPRGRGHLGIRVLHAGVDGAQVAVLAEGALLVAGDDVSVGMRVGPGVRLDVVEPAGTVAFDMRGGSARWGVAVEVDDGGELVWRAEPFVVATGAVVDRELERQAARFRRCRAARGAGPRTSPRGRWPCAATASRHRVGPPAAGRGSRPRRCASAGGRHRRPPRGRLGDRPRAASRPAYSARCAPAGARGTGNGRAAPRRADAYLAVGAVLDRLSPPPQAPSRSRHDAASCPTGPPGWGCSRIRRAGGSPRRGAAARRSRCPATPRREPSEPRSTSSCCPARSPPGTGSGRPSCGSTTAVRRWS